LLTASQILTLLLFRTFQILIPSSFTKF
jgi:hypothetical protein